MRRQRAGAWRDRVIPSGPWGGWCVGARLYHLHPVRRDRRTGWWDVCYSCNHDGGERHAEGYEATACVCGCPNFVEPYCLDCGCGRDYCTDPAGHFPVTNNA
jgi:hypothetical protein